MKCVPGHTFFAFCLKKMNPEILMMHLKHIFAVQFVSLEGNSEKLSLGCGSYATLLYSLSQGKSLN